MLQRLGGRNLGSESSAWAALLVLAGIQYSFNFISPHLLRWIVPYAALATCLCLFAIGIAIASLEGKIKRTVAIGFSLLMLLVSLSHLATAKHVPAADISEAIRTPNAAQTEDEDESDGEEVERPPEGSFWQARRVATVKGYANGIQVESRVDQVGRLHRLTWRLRRGGDTLLCGPIFLGGDRAQADQMLQTRLGTSLSRSNDGDLTCE